MDRRECGRVPEILRARADVELREGVLGVGDYVVEGGITIERKTRGDFLASLSSGRLFRQAARLKRTAVRPLLLVEGLLLGGGSRAALPPDILGALTSLSAMWYLPVLHSSGAEETVQTLVLLGRQHAADRSETWLCPVQRPRNQTLEAVRARMLCAIPGIGPKRAKRLLDRFGTITALAQSPPEALTAVKGVGPSGAHALRTALGPL